MHQQFHSPPSPPLSANRCADALLLNLYRWICSPSSQLYDPALKQTVQTLMRKLLLHLVGELRRLGATVVQAGRDAIIVCTGKGSLRAGLGYVDHVLETLRRREILQYINFVPGRVWHALLFRNRYDYVGVAADVPPDVLQALGTPGGLGDGELLERRAAELRLRPEDLAAPRFDHVFTLSEFLPPALHSTFAAMLTRFLWLPWRAVREAGDAAEAQGASQGGSQAVQRAGPAAERELAALRDLIAEQLTPALLKYIRHVAAHVALGDGNPDHQFPIRAGSHLSEVRGAFLKG